MLRQLCGVACLALLCACGTSEEPWAVRSLATPALPGSAQAQLAGGVGLPLVLSWQEPQPDGSTALQLARFDVDADIWQAVATVAAGENWFVNWADFPSVVPLAGGAELIAHWLELKPDQPYAYDIRYALSHDGGTDWDDIGVLNGDTAIAEHGFVSFFDWGEDIGAIWLDGRELAALTIDELFELEEPVGMVLRYARLDAAGAVLERGEIDDLVCDCCQTDAVTTPEGPLIVYRNRTDAEVRDIAVRHVSTAGSTARWSAPAMLGPDGWIIDGCPVNGPAAAADGGDVAVAWFTAAENRPRIRFARSSDGGRSFAPATTLAGEGSLGQVDVVVSADGTAWVSAWHQADTGMELRVHRVARSGEIDTRVVAGTTSSLPTDVPQLALSGGQLILVWSELGEYGGEPGGLHSAAVPLW